VTIYALADAADAALFPRPVYVGRTARTVEARLRSHRAARRARWLNACNADLARWLESHTPAVIVLDEVPEDADLWAAEKAWIEKFADLGLYNKFGNPARSPKRRDGLRPGAVAA